jgi:pimeloyl-ACP methyl ester carboxylesterase
MAYAALLAGSQVNLLPAPAALLKGGAKQASQPTAPRDGYLAINGIRIHFLEWGRSGPVLVMLHGLYDDASVWKSLAPYLSPDYHIIALDRRGAGRSDTPMDGYDHATLVSDVLAVIRQNKLGPVNVIGHSAGAETALLMAATAPKTVRSLTMIDGGFWPRRDAPPAFLPAPCTRSPKECARQALENSSRQYDPEMLYPRTYCPTLLILARPNAPTGDEVEEYRKRGINYLDQLKEAERHAREVADKKLAHGRMVVIENTSHWIQRDQPLALTQSIRAFLSGIR